MAGRLYEIVCLLHWQRSKPIISPRRSHFEIWATPPPPPPKTSHPWNTSQARYLPELPGGRSKPPPGTFIQYIQWNLLIERKLDLAYCVRHKGGGGQGVPHSQFPPPFPPLPSPFSPTSLPLLPHFPPPNRFFPPPDKMLFLFKN